MHIISYMYVDKGSIIRTQRSFRVVSAATAFVTHGAARRSRRAKPLL